MVLCFLIEMVEYIKPYDLYYYFNTIVFGFFKQVCDSLINIVQNLRIIYIYIYIILKLSKYIYVCIYMWIRSKNINLIFFYFFYN